MKLTWTRKGEIEYECEPFSVNSNPSNLAYLGKKPIILTLHVNK